MDGKSWEPTPQFLRPGPLQLPHSMETHNSSAPSHYTRSKASHNKPYAFFSPCYGKHPFVVGALRGVFHNVRGRVQEAGGEQSCTPPSQGLVMGRGLIYPALHTGGGGCEWATMQPGPVYGVPEGGDHRWCSLPNNGGTEPPPSATGVGPPAR